MAYKWIPEGSGPVVRCSDKHDVTLERAECGCHNAYKCEEHDILFMQVSGTPSTY